MTFAGKGECCSTHLWGSQKPRHFSTLFWKLVKGLIFCFLSFKAQFSSVTVSQFLKINSRRNLDNTESFKSTGTVFMGNIMRNNKLPDVGLGRS